MAHFSALLPSVSDSMACLCLTCLHEVLDVRVLGLPKVPLTDRVVGLFRVRVVEEIVVVGSYWETPLDRHTKLLR